MDFQTKVELPAGLPPVSHAERILLMGSCFAENMGRLLAENKFRVDMNPFVGLYCFGGDIEGEGVSGERLIPI